MLRTQYAAGVNCRDRIKAVVSLSPGYISVLEPADCTEETIKYLADPDRSSENTKDRIVIHHLQNITAATLVVGNEIEYDQMDALRLRADHLFNECGAQEKEFFFEKQLYPGQHFSEPHVFLGYKDGGKKMREYGGGQFLQTTLSFIRRKLVGQAEAPPKRPDTAAVWITPEENFDCRTSE